MYARQLIATACLVALAGCNTRSDELAASNEALGRGVATALMAYTVSVDQVAPSPNPSPNGVCRFCNGQGVIPHGDTGGLIDCPDCDTKTTASVPAEAESPSSLSQSAPTTGNGEGQEATSSPDLTSEVAASAFYVRRNYGMAKQSATNQGLPLLILLIEESDDDAGAWLESAAEELSRLPAVVCVQSPGNWGFAAPLGYVIERGKKLGKPWDITSDPADFIDELTATLLEEK